MADAPSPPVADLLDGVRWDYDPEQEEVSPLISVERYFRDFPWEPPEVMAENAPPPS